MDEDLELNRLVKASLEARAPFVWKGAEAASRRRGGLLARLVRPWQAALLAASAALVLLFNYPEAGETASVDDALLLLSEAEDMPSDLAFDASPTALLVAWQGAALSGRDDALPGDVL